MSWEVGFRDRFHGHGDYAVIDDEGNVIAEVKTGLLDDARKLAAAPELLAACEAQHEAIDRLLAMLAVRDERFFPSKSGQPWEALKQGNATIAKATTPAAIPAASNPTRKEEP